jgi:hypothetical protein
MNIKFVQGGWGRKAEDADGVFRPSRRFCLPPWRDSTQRVADFHSTIADFTLSLGPLAPALAKSFPRQRPSLPRHANPSPHPKRRKSNLKPEKAAAAACGVYKSYESYDNSQSYIKEIRMGWDHKICNVIIGGGSKL